VERAYQQALFQLDEVEFRIAMDQPEDALGCILEINAGAGGTESCDWTAMLMRMYIMWAEKSGFKVTELNIQDGDVAGVKSVELEIKGEYCYGMLKGENGVHRLVRVSPFNAQGKRMTSFSSVFVHPLVDDSIEVDVNPADLEWDTFRSSGAGGQHVNKTDSAVRITHFPSGIVVQCQNERSQGQNKEIAMKMLMARLVQKEKDEQSAKKAAIQKKKIEWGSQIRSYILHPYKLVKDHRTDLESQQPEMVLDGDILPFIEANLIQITAES